MPTSEQEELVLIAEDNPEDAMLMRKAIAKAGIRAQVRVLTDGEQVLLYLEGRGAYANHEANPMPSLVILDLKMPRKSGFEVLEWLQEHQEYSVVPTIVMSASGIENDVRKAYHLGANTFFVKPTTFDQLVATMKSVAEYWAKAKTSHGTSADGARNRL